MEEAGCSPGLVHQTSRFGLCCPDQLAARTVLKVDLLKLGLRVQQSLQNLNFCSFQLDAGTSPHLKQSAGAKGYATATSSLAAIDKLESSFEQSAAVVDSACCVKTPATD